MPKNAILSAEGAGTIDIGFTRLSKKLAPAPGFLNDDSDAISDHLIGQEVL